MGLSQKENSLKENHMFNHCFISGRVCSEPELEYSKSHDAYCTFQFLFQAWGCPTGKIEVSCLKDVALFAGRYLHQGDRVAVAGILYISKVGGDDGETREEAAMLATALELVKDDDHIQLGGLPKRRQ
jgi:single-stranded DNA-binding protein